MATIEGGFASFSCFILDNQLHTHTTPTHVTSIIFFSLPTKKKRKRKNQEPNQTSRVKQLPCSRRFSSFSFSSFFFFCVVFSIVFPVIGTRICTVVTVIARERHTFSVRRLRVRLQSVSLRVLRQRRQGFLGPHSTSFVDGRGLGGNLLVTIATEGIGSSSRCSSATLLESTSVGGLGVAVGGSAICVGGGGDRSSGSSSCGGSSSRSSGILLGLQLQDLYKTGKYSLVINQI